MREKGVLLVILVFLLVVSSSFGIIESVEKTYETNSVFLWKPAQPSLSSVGVNGEVSGDGIFSITLVDEADSYVILSQEVNGAGYFSNACQETCNISLSNDKYLVRVDVEGVAVTLNSLVYNEPLNQTSGSSNSSQSGSNESGPSFSVSFSGSGSGSASDPFIITNCTQLQEMNDSLSANYSLGNDIDCSDTVNWHGGKGLDPVGDGSNKFTGSLDGNGSTISHLYKNRTTENNVGMFGHFNGISINNFTLANVSVSGKELVGGVVGRLQAGNMSFITVTGEINGFDNVAGGVLGRTDNGNIADSSFTGTVTATGSTVGGFIGNSNEKIERSFANANVTANANVGGFAGACENSCLINNSYAIGNNISGSGNVAGFVGIVQLSSIVDRSYATSKVITSGTEGGFVATNTATVQNSFWDTDTSQQSSSAGGTGKSTAEMYIESTYVGWDFGSVWSLSSTVNNGYPNLLGVSISGSGTVGDPFMIEGCSDLQNIASNLSAYYELENDIDCSDTINWDAGKGFDPIAGFTGNFNGNNYTISDLYINRPSDSNTGLFSSISGGDIKDFLISNARVVGNDYTGSVVGFFTSGTASNIHANGEINNTGHNCGGFVGRSVNGIISDSSFQGNVTSTFNVVGGFAGSNYEQIHRSFAIANVTGLSNVGGFAGITGFASDITNQTYAHGTATGTSNVGGFMGTNIGTIINSYSTTKVSGTSNVGGFVGSNSGNVNDSFWDNETSSQSSSAGGTGKSTAQMYAQSTYVNWDFTNVWELDEGANYPVLRSYLSTLNQTQCEAEGYFWKGFCSASSFLVIGNTSDVTVPFGLLNITVDGSDDLQNVTVGFRNISFTLDGNDVVQFFFNFSEEKLNLTNIIINTSQNGSQNTHFLVSNLDLAGDNKTVYFEKSNENTTVLCVKDAQLTSLNQITSLCDDPFETLLECNNVTVNGKTCVIENGRYKVTGLQNTGIVELNTTYCGVLNQSNTQYNLLIDVNSSSTCMEVTADNITLDCGGNSIIGEQNGIGVYAHDVENFHVVDCSVENYTRAIYFDSANHSLVSNVTFNLTQTSGNGNLVIVNNSEYVNITENVFNSISIDTLFTNAGTLIGFENTDFARVEYNNISGNTIESDITTGSLGIGFFRDSDNSITAHNIISGNTFTADTVVYGGSVIGAVENADDGLVYNNTIENNNIDVIFISGGGVVGFYNSISSYAIYDMNIFDNTITSDNVVGSSVIGGTQDLTNSNFTNITLGGNTVTINNDLFGGSIVGLYFSSTGNIFEDITINETGTNGHVVGVSEGSNNNIFRNFTVTNIQENIIGVTNSSNFDTVGNLFTQFPTGTLFVSSNESFNLNNSFNGTFTIVVFQNEFGRVNFTSGKNMSGLNLQPDINISYNLLMTELNDTVNLTLFDIGDLGFSEQAILYNGKICIECVNYTPLNDTNVLFKVNESGNYSVGNGTCSSNSDCLTGFCSENNVCEPLLGLGDVCDVSFSNTSVDNDFACGAAFCDADLNDTHRCHATETSCVNGANATETVNGSGNCFSATETVLCLNATWQAPAACNNVDECSSDYQILDYAGTCSGAGVCDSGVVVAVSDGDVCQAGASVNPSNASTCGANSNSTCHCDTFGEFILGACSATEYYTGYNASGSCIDTDMNATGNIFIVPSTFTINNTINASNGSAPISTTTYCSNADTCSVYTLFQNLACNGTGSCALPVNDVSCPNNFGCQNSTACHTACTNQTSCRNSTFYCEFGGTSCDADEAHGISCSNAFTGTGNEACVDGNCDSNLICNFEPTLAVTEPNGVNDDNRDVDFTAAWTAGDADGDSLTISCYADTDFTGQNISFIAFEDNATIIGSDTETFSVENWTQGNFSLFCIINDTFSTTTNYSTGFLQVNHEPENFTADDNGAFIVNDNETVLFDGTWADPTDYVGLYVSNTSNDTACLFGNTTNCLCFQENQTDGTGDCSSGVSGFGNQTWYAWACDNQARCSVQVNDTYEVNRQPTIGTPIFNGTFDSDDLLNCSIQNYTDLDGDSIGSFNVKWYHNGTFVPNETGETLDLSQPGFDKGDTFFCSMSVSDEHGYFSLFSDNSSNFTIPDGPPTTPSGSSINGSFIGNATIIVSGNGSIDPDGDNFSYEFQFSCAAGGVVQNFSTNGTFHITPPCTEGENLTIKIKAVNSLESGNETIVESIIVDFPQFSLPAGFVLPGSSASLDVNATDNSGIDEYTVNNTNFTIDSTGLITNITELLLSNYTIEIFANDTLGNSNTTPFSIFVADVNPPLIGSINVTNGTITSLNTFVPIFYNASDSFLDEGFLVVTSPNGTNNTFSVVQSGVNFTTSVNLTTVGQHDVFLSANDSFSNVGSGFIYFVVLDNDSSVNGTVFNTNLTNVTIGNINGTNCELLNVIYINASCGDSSDNSSTQHSGFLFVDPSVLADNDYYGNVTIIDSTIFRSLINNSNITNSTINDSFIHNSTLLNLTFSGETVFTNNFVPRVISPISDQTFSGTIIINLSTVFSDFGGDALNFTVSGSGANISGNNLTVTTTGTFTVTATDGVFNTSDSFTISSSSSSSGGGGGGGGGGSSIATVQEDVVCSESWICESWSSCESGEQTRACFDVNDCGTAVRKPIEFQECDIGPVVEEIVVEEPERKPIEEPLVVTIKDMSKYEQYEAIAISAGIVTIAIVAIIIITLGIERSVVSTRKFIAKERAKHAREEKKKLHFKEQQTLLKKLHSKNSKLRSKLTDQLHKITKSDVNEERRKMEKVYDRLVRDIEKIKKMK